MRLETLTNLRIEWNSYELYLYGKQQKYWWTKWCNKSKNIHSAIDKDASSLMLWKNWELIQTMWKICLSEPKKEFWTDAGSGILFFVRGGVPGFWIKKRFPGSRKWPQILLRNEDVHEVSPLLNDFWVPGRAPTMCRSEPGSGSQVESEKRIWIKKDILFQILKVGIRITFHYILRIS